MDYGVVGKSAVPHVTTLGAHFKIEYAKYKYSLIIECSFIILVLPLLAIWIYFSAKYKKPKKQKQPQPEQGQGNESGQNRKSASFHPSQIDAKSEYIAENELQNRSGTSSFRQNNKSMQDEFTLDSAGKANSQQTKKKLQITERRICYGVCYFVVHVIAVNSFDAGLLTLITFYLTLAFYGLFNIIRPIKNAFLMALFIAPVFAGGFAVWLGDHVLGVHTG